MDFKTIDKFGGYNSSGDRTKLEPNILVRGSKNVTKLLNGNIGSREGRKLRGSVDSTNAGVKASFEWETSVGNKRHLRVVDGKLEVESDILESGTQVWYELLLTSSLDSLASSLTRFVFDTWWDNDEKTDRLLMVRGDDTILHWSGGMALVDSATANTITKKGAKTWAEEGFATQVAGEKKIVINGTEYTYTGGESTTSLTGVTPNPSGEAEDSVVIQAVHDGTLLDEGTNLEDFEADFIKVVENQVWLGSYSSRVIWISSNNTIGSELGFLKYNQAGALVYGDPDALVLDSPARGIGVKDGKVIIFAGDSDMYVVKPNDDLQISQAAVLLAGGSSRVVIQRVEKKRLPGLQVALGHEFIDNLGDYLVWLDRKNQLRALGVFTDNDSIRPIHLSLPIQDELRDDDFTGGHVKSIEDTVHITAPNSGRDYMYQVREIVDDNNNVRSEKIWQPPQIRGISRFAIFDGVVHGHSNVNPQVYQIFDTNQWSDDHPSGQAIPYTCVAKWAYRNHEREQGLLTFDKIFFEGYTYDGVYLYGNVYFDYQGSTSLYPIELNNIESTKNKATFFFNNTPPSFGDSSFGDNPLGDGIIPEGGERELLPKFRRIVDINQKYKNCFEYALEVYSLNPDSRWEISALGPNARLAKQQPTFLRKA